MLSGDLPAGAHLHPEVSLTVEGVAVPGVVDWDYARDLGMKLPGVDDVAPAAGTGSLTIAPARAGVNGGASPWGSGEDAAPTPSSAAVLVLALSPDHSWPVATGFLDAPSGSMWDGAVRSHMIDPIDSLAVPLNWDAAHARQTPLGPGAPFRLVGLTNAYVVDRAMRDAGWFSTPPTGFSTGALDVPMCGSMLARRGLLEYTADSFPAWTARDSMPQAACALGDVEAIYRITQTTLGNFEVFMEVDPATSDAGTIRWDVIDAEGSGKGYRFTYDQATKVFRVQRADRMTPGVTTIGTTLASVTLTPADHRVTARVRRFQNQAGDAKEVELRTVTGTGASSSTLAGVYLLSQTADWRVYLTTTGSAAVGAFGIDNPVVPFATASWVPNTDVKFTFGSVHPLKATPRLSGGITALDVLRDQARAEFAAWGFDEDGRLFYKSRAWLQARPLARTLTAADLVDFSWQHDTTAARSSVTIQHKVPAIVGRHYPSVTVWQGNGDSLDAGESGSVVMAPEADEDWVRVDAAFDEAGFTVGSSGNWNTGIGSFWGGSLVNSADGTDSWAHNAAGHLTASVTQINSTTFALDYQVAATLPADTRVELRTPESTGLRRRGVGLPILRAYGATRWLDRDVTLGASSDKRAPRLVHDVAWHVQDSNALAALHAWIVDRVSTSRPRLSGVRIKPDPRLQIGDRVRVVDDREGGTGADVTGLVVSKSLSGSPGSVEMTIDVVEL